ncbi:MAG: MBL fold metallo-hydrolase, partial [Alphaproteobacteria bacterium]|nr:MBL fold metallo-hydrolase [Alphaproteobacteria bacterium]
MQAVILGSGTAGGTPRIGNNWGACDPEEPRNRRRRASILVRDGATQILIDTSPDLRQQALDAAVDRLDA